jgi:hypothetical protein
VTVDQVAGKIACGPDEEGFMDFYRKELQPLLS